MGFSLKISRVQDLTEEPVHDLIGECPFFFALAIKEILAQAAEEYPECEVGGYLDDINVVPIGPPVFQMERLFDVLVHKNSSSVYLCFI